MKHPWIFNFFSTLHTFFFSFFFILTLSGCIHFKIGDSHPQKASDIFYIDPPVPFVLAKNMNADMAWQSTTTGNMIAVISNCSKNSDQSLSYAFLEISKGFDRLDSSQQELFFFNGRQALKGQLRGTIDGIAVSMESLQFNKNQCFYQLTYSGLAQHFESEQNYFEQFKKEFKAP